MPKGKGYGGSKSSQGPHKGDAWIKGQMPYGKKSDHKDFMSDANAKPHKGKNEVM